MTISVEPVPAIAGSVTLPADKSISHRAALFAAMAEGESEIVGFSDAADPHSTLGCLRALGVEITDEDDSIKVKSRGLRSWRASAGPLDCGNSGTTMRLIAGLLAGQRFESTLIGDASLSARPMARIANPLREMGAEIIMTDGHAPLTIRPRRLIGTTYALPMASAQVKSCVLLAGHLADGTTTVIEPVPTRDHTERLLGLDTLDLGGVRHISVEGGQTVQPGLWVVPRDVSASAFFLVAASILENATLEMASVGLNPTRSAVIDVLRAMGADIRITNEREHNREPLADLRVYAPSSGLVGIELGGAIIANLIDEIPIIAVAAALADGPTTIRDAGELRVKETDRIMATATMLRAFGVEVVEREDGMTIYGRGRTLLRGGQTIESFHDHRIAMAAGVAALATDAPTTIRDADAARISFPTFWDELDAMAGGQIVSSALS
ncbi:MAG: 3-phosphoshikimate 1-carboxyvinyltransferase [Bacteroidota bacterium]